MKKTFKRTSAFVCAMAVMAAPMTFSSFVANAEGETVTSDYTLTIPATLAVENSGWNSIGDLTATGTLAQGKKLNVTATSENSWKLTSGENTVAYKLCGETEKTKTYADAAATTSLDISKESLEQTDGFSVPIGIVVEDYSEKPAGDYSDTVTFTAKVEDAVKVETLLTTITATGKTTYNQSKEGVVTVTPANIEYYDDTYGWLWNGTITVEPMEGYTITKCRFIQNSKTPLDDDLAPFSIVMNDFSCSVITSTGQKGGGDMDGVTSIEVYGYAN